MEGKRSCYPKWIFTGCGLLGIIAGGLMADSPCYGSLDVSGYLESSQIIRLDDPYEFLSSQTGARLELTAENGDTKGFLSGDLFYNEIDPDDDQFRLREAYLDYQYGQWDFRIGRQIIAWGKADGVQVTDLICPTDYRDYFCYEFSDTKKPVEAVKTGFRKGNMMTELVWVPFFEPISYPSDDNPWLTDSEMGTAVKEALQPEKNLKNSEWFGRIAFNQVGFDYALSVFHCWWDTPVYQGVVEDGGLVLQGEYYRVTGIGGEFSVPVGDLVLRGETAFLKGRRFERDSYSGDDLERDVFNALLGMDWYPGNNWTITTQVTDEMILDYDSAIARDEHQWIGTVKITKNLLRETLTLSGSVYSALTEEDYYLKLSTEYALTDALHLTSGLLFFGGDADGNFGTYHDKDAFLVKLKYSF